jgi:hypothetical protein
MDLCTSLITLFIKLDLMQNSIYYCDLHADNFKQKCGHKSYDDFQELQKGAIVELANDLFKAGYITNAQVSGQASGPMSNLVLSVNNIFIGARRRITGLRSSTLPVISKPSSVKSIALQCLPSQKCRWLHMCLKKPPYATKLEPMHVCKDEEQNDFTDATFFQALRKAYFDSKSWREKPLFKLRRIEFVEVSFLLSSPCLQLAETDDNSSSSAPRTLSTISSLINFLLLSRNTISSLLQRSKSVLQLAPRT